MIRQALLATVVVAAVVVAGPLQAQEPAQPTTPLAGGYTIEKLTYVLTKLGYEPTVYGTNKDRCWISLERGEFKTTCCFLLGKDLKTLWFETPLSTPPSLYDANPAALQRLLEENDKIGPAHFKYDSTDKQLRLALAVVNRDWTPARLKKEFEAYDDLLRRTEKLWHIDNFLRLAPVSEELSKPELAKLEGVWKLVDGSSGGKPSDKEALAKSDIRLTIKGDTLMYPASKQPSKLIIDPSRKALDVVADTGRVECGLYKLEGDKLTLHLAVLGQPRPASLTPGEGDTRNVLILERVNP